MQHARPHVAEVGDPRGIDARARLALVPIQHERVERFLQIEDHLCAIVERELRAVRWQVAVSLLEEVIVEAGLLPSPMAGEEAEAREVRRV